MYWVHPTRTKESVGRNYSESNVSHGPQMLNSAEVVLNASLSSLERDLHYRSVTLRYSTSTEALMDQERKNDWRELWRAAGSELDPEKLMQLIAELTKALDARDKTRQDPPTPINDGDTRQS